MRAPSRPARAMAKGFSEKHALDWPRLLTADYADTADKIHASGNPSALSA
jgi:hypothetical protein